MNAEADHHGDEHHKTYDVVQSPVKIGGFPILDGPEVFQTPVPFGLQHHHERRNGENDVCQQKPDITVHEFHPLLIILNMRISSELVTLISSIEIIQGAELNVL